MSRDTTHTVSCRPLTSEVRGFAPGSVHMGIWWTKWHWVRFFIPVLRFYRVSNIPLLLCIFMYHVAENNRPVSGRS